MFLVGEVDVWIELNETSKELSPDIVWQSITFIQHKLAWCPGGKFANTPYDKDIKKYLEVFQKEPGPFQGTKNQN